jgi:Zn-dependent protease with chaperone function
VIVTGFAVAIVQAIQAQQWTVAVVLAAVTVAAVFDSVADAAVRRRSELAADRYATGVGVAPALASALQVIGCGQDPRPGLASRLLSSHPTNARRLAALQSGSSGASVVPAASPLP